MTALAVRAPILAPAALTGRAQWVVWRSEARDGRLTKVPYRAIPGGMQRASSTDPETWTTYHSALAYYQDNPWTSGIGYVLTAEDPFVGVDLDKCRDPESELIADWALGIVRELDTYTEISPSGQGLRIFALGTLPPGGRRKGSLEIYSAGRFLTVTGNRLPIASGRIEDRADAILALHARTFPPTPKPERNGTAAPRGPIALDDVEIVRLARRASNGDAFWRLWNGDWSSSYDSQSSADLALCSYLAFYTGPDRARIEGLFRQSGLYRGKWDSKRNQTTYGAQTVEKALSTMTEFYAPPSERLVVAETPHSNGAVRNTAGHAVDPETGEIVADPSPYLSLGELIRSAPAQEGMVVEGLLWVAKRHWTYSAPGVGKTLWKMAQWLHVAAGRDFCGRAVQQGPVLVIEEDSSHVVVAEYAELLADLYGFDLAGLPFWINRYQGVRITDDRGIEAAWNLIDGAPERPLILGLDACERVVPSDRFTSNELDPLDRLMVRCTNAGIATDVIDHTRKPSTAPVKGAVAPVDPIDLLYGGRAKGAISDVMHYLSGSLKTSVRVQWAKFRGEAPPVFDVTFDGIEHGFRVRQLARRLSDQEQAVMRVLNNAFEDDGWVQRDRLEAELNKSESTVRRVLDRLEAVGYVETDGGGRGKTSRVRRTSAAPGAFTDA